MRLLIIAGCLALVCGAAQAETQLYISPAACDQLVNYIEPPGVEYQPGVDANGNPVAPADLGGTRRIKPPSHIVIPITDYLASRLKATGGTAASATTTGTGTTAGNVLQPQANLGTVELTDGQVTYNGQPLGEDVDGDLGVLCRKIRREQ